MYILLLLLQHPRKVTLVYLMYSCFSLNFGSTLFWSQPALNRGSGHNLPTGFVIRLPVRAGPRYGLAELKMYVTHFCFSTHS